jgi:3-oxoadipate enol-lactonase
MKLNVNGISMNVDIHAGAVPMDTVFIHGNLASNRWWEPSIALWNKDAKASNEGRIIALEWRGCGQSEAPKSESELDPYLLADDCIAALKQMGVKKACLVGHSTGGLIGLIALLKAPELFDRAALLDPVSAAGVSFEPERLDTFTQMSQNRDFCMMVMSGTIQGVDTTSPFFQNIVSDAFGIAKPIWHGIPKALSKVNIVADLPKIKQPVLVLHGEHDPVLPIEESRSMAATLPNGKFKMLNGQGHSTNVENPSLFVQLTNDFLFNRA